MATSRYRVLALPATLLILSPILGGCGKSAAPTAARPSDSMSQQTADDLALHFASTLSKGGVPLNQAGATTLQAVALGRVALPRSGAPLSATDEAGFSWSLSVRFFDADGDEQPLFVPGSTSRLSLVGRAHGSVSSSRHQASVGIYRALDVDGLLPDVTTLEVDGAARDTADCAFAAHEDQAAREYHLLADGSLTDVRSLKDTAVNPYPLSGTARWQVRADAVEGDHQAHYRATVVVTFNGTRYPMIEVDETYDYTFDLETGEIQRHPA